MKTITLKQIDKLIIEKLNLIESNSKEQDLEEEKDYSKGDYIVKALKKNPEVDNPYAIKNSMINKGYKIKNKKSSIKESFEFTKPYVIIIYGGPDGVLDELKYDDKNEMRDAYYHLRNEGYNCEMWIVDENGQPDNRIYESNITTLKDIDNVILETIKSNKIKFILTGSPDEEFGTKSDFVERLNKNKVEQTTLANADVVVAGSWNPASLKGEKKSHKVAYAEEHGIKVMNYKAFLKKYGK